MTVLERLTRERLYFDGAMGTELQRLGQIRRIPESLNLEQPALVERIHLHYLESGAHIVTANTFGANRYKLEPVGLRPEAVIVAGVGAARRAVAKHGFGYVAVSMGPTGKMMEPLGELSLETAYETYRQMVTAADEAAADLILFETFSDLAELKAAVLAAKENSRLPIFTTLTFDEQGTLLTGGSIEAAVSMLEGLGVSAIGFNCGLGPHQVEKLMPRMLKATSVPVIANPNAGLPQLVNGETRYDVGPGEFAKVMSRMAAMGVSVLGGCCGTTPEYIAEMVGEVRGIPFASPKVKPFAFVSSAVQAVPLGPVPVIIGERINPTGKKRFKQALREENLDYLLSEGLAEQTAGAHILDVNVGLPEIDEEAMMAAAIQTLQHGLRTPLQIDSSNPAVLERAACIYTGKPLINSVNGKAASMEAVFPVIQRYGGAVIGLTLDETGIPGTPEGRLAIARRIVERAGHHGIAPKDILIDPLTLTISSNQREALITLESLALIRKELGVGTVLGVSNISFGLPNRESINTAFFTMALQQGLTAAIINPLSPVMMGAYYSALALMGQDPDCRSYIGFAAPAAEKPVAAKDTLYNIVLQGRKERAADLARELLAVKAPLDVVQQDIMPALDEVGRRYEAGKLFLPELLTSAETVQQAFTVIKAKLEESGQVGEGKGPIVLATVEGDIHDIGKNIVKVVLQNYGYGVIDLGKDVPVARVVEVARDTNAPLVGLSALMTTTTPSMEKTITALREAALPCKVVVGGAVLTETFARQMGADFYAKDALATVRAAREVIG